MPLNFSENRRNIEAGRETALRLEVEKLKKLLEVKEKELRSALENSSLKKEILNVREKIKTQNVEYEKIKEKREGEAGGGGQDFEEIALMRKSVPTKQQIKTIAGQIDDVNVRHQISILVNLALTKSIYYAVKIARRIGNAYLLDRFHDAIVNELYEDLVKKKKIKPIK